MRSLAPFPAFPTIAAIDAHGREFFARTAGFGPEAIRRLVSSPDSLGFLAATRGRSALPKRVRLLGTEGWRDIELPSEGERSLPQLWTFVDPRCSHCEVFLRTVATVMAGRRLRWYHVALGVDHGDGAQVAFPSRQVVTFSGDGGLSMLLGDDQKADADHWYIRRWVERPLPAAVEKPVTANGVVFRP